MSLHLDVCVQVGVETRLEGFFVSAEFRESAVRAQKSAFARGRQLGRAAGMILKF